eukprot:188483-Amphidinium_carterae.2
MRSSASSSPTDRSVLGLSRRAWRHRAAIADSSLILSRQGAPACPSAGLGDGAPARLSPPSASHLGCRYSWQKQAKHLRQLRAVGSLSCRRDGPQLFSAPIVSRWFPR